ncbi:HNH endonuclease signature motif containing protein [Cyclobacterium amurskyense]|uniref:HNH endonuclease n=1 Tax=Cyclobacterium amurskyense TaxID=320787 RepID=A0A0H4PE06_9BACT|nr:HNH endonuclease signature motif containing protein [Cyclobacterium amurskyense]AKP52701.1 HNH endonuclease [Cyclobacterium amurskyense]
MNDKLLDIFQIEKTCKYRGEVYHVRDNGAIYRCRRSGKRKRPLDEKWTIGNRNKLTGYRNIGSETVHRIVATAFHGPQPSEDHIVDHFDTNRQNNRPENLAWVTRLENILLNPITARRIKISYGSIEKFLKDPTRPISGNPDPRLEWMRAVTKEEADHSRQRLLDWANGGKIPSGGILGDWLYELPNEQFSEEPSSEILIESKTSGAIQKSWKTPSEFPLCPSNPTKNGLQDYYQRIKEGDVFARNNFGESKVVSAALSERSDVLLVMCHHPGAIKEWSLAQVSIDDHLFIHESLGTFFQLEGAKKQFTLKRGLKWEGGDSIDDIC